MALGAGKKTQQGSAKGYLKLGVSQLAQIYQGGLAMMSGAFVRAARAGQGGNDLAKMADVALSRVVGVSLATAIGGAADGTVTNGVEAGDWLAKNSAGVDAITAADIGRYCFVIDDETVAKTSAAGTRPRAGVVADVDATGVMVKTGPLVAAGALRSMILPFAINETDTLAPTNAELVSPVAGNIIRMTVIVQKTVTTGGDVTLVNGAATAVVGLACTIADGAVKGAVVTGAPTNGDASTVVAPGGRIQVAPAAAFNTAGAVSGYVEIAY
jgi:hypothetical protein